MGANNGTGHPLTFACAKCRVKGCFGSDDSRRWRFFQHHKWVATGARRKRWTGNNPAGRVDPVYQYGYQCLDCGHVGWSRHISVKKAWERIPT